MRLLDFFADKSGQPVIQPGQRILNYVWQPKSSKSIALMLQGMDNIFANAKKYPETQIDFWVDLKVLSDASRTAVQDHLRKNGLKNVQLRDLDEIPSFKNSPQLQVGSSTDIKSRVDLIRLYVIQHALSTTQARDILYSDIDVKDAQLNYKPAQRALEQYGMFFAKSFRRPIENGYMAIRRNSEGEDFLKTSLIPQTEQEVAINNDGFLPLLHGCKAWGNARGRKNFYKLLGVLPVPSTGKAMRVSPQYKLQEGTL